MGWLQGRTVVVTRSRERQGPLVDLLGDHGAAVVELPLIETREVPGEVQRLADEITRHQWLAVTSPSGAALLRRLAVPSEVHVAAVGPSTAQALSRCDVIATVHSGAGLVDEMGAGQQRTVLVVEARGAAPTLTRGLSDAGWVVTAVQPYTTVTVAPPADQVAAALAADAVVFASGSAARAWAEQLGTEGPAVMVAMGPQTASDARQVGLKISLVAADHTVHGIVSALDSIPPPIG
jgi:uroporphyrinogen-III synthase